MSGGGENNTGSNTHGNTETDTGVDGDPYGWLEEVTGDAALDWVRGHNERTTETLAATEDFERLRADLLEVLDSDARIPYVTRRGEYLYNFWRDATHPRGLWRRTTLAEYRGERPEWDVLIDLDALAAEEDENWVWHGTTACFPDYRRCLVELSRGGADACVVREFDTERREFVADGFTLEEAKTTTLTWVGEDTVYVGTDFGPDTLTTSGYPRTIRRWHRGTPLAEAPVVFEGETEDVAVSAMHDPAPGFERALFSRHPTFYRTHFFLLDGEELRRVEIPEDAELDVHREWLIVHLRSEWTVGGRTHPAGTLLGTTLDGFMDGGREMTVLFAPEPSVSLQFYGWTANHLVITMLRDVRAVARVLTPGPDGFTAAELDTGAEEFASIDVLGLDRLRSDEYLLEVSGFTTPAELRRGVVGEGTEVLKRAPEFFDADGLSVRQCFADSDDGTRIPYFVVRAEDAGPGPTLLYGYGGFEISMTPGYSGVIGRAWLRRGGTYVVANIRGGAEYGPEWHSSVLKPNRLRVYEDFSAVARDLVARGFCTRDQLGMRGGSNGGLLAGVMLTRYPELFGAIVCQVPLLDMRRYHVLLAGASWMAEYGNPDVAEEWEYIKEYSPYHNVRSGQPYPPVLFTTSTRDDRVHPGHARKMVARLGEFGYSPVYYENIEGGHGGAADNKQSAFMSALNYEFLWRRLS